MNILLVSHKYPPYSLGGVEVYTYHLARALQAQHQVSVFFRHDDREGAPFAELDREVDGVRTRRVSCNPAGLEASVAGEFFDTFMNRRIEDSFARFVAQVQPDLVDKIDDTVATARPNTGYGMTETCGVITSISADFFVAKPESCGPVLPNFEAKIVDDAGNAASQGQVGELWVRGAPVIRGYLNRPDATAESITDGWLHTGDIARMDEDGFLYIVDRAKDMVIRGGENVYCAEVESAIYEHPGVAECSVFGVEDERLGEEVGVAVFLKPGQTLDADELRTHCKERISPHKVPRYIWFMAEALPQNANGKFLKRQLRDTLNTAEAA